MTSRHYKWQARWAIDRAAGVATHECGLVVRTAPGGGRLLVDNAPEITAALITTHGGHNAPRMVARMLREAAELLAAERARDARLTPTRTSSEGSP